MKRFLALFMAILMGAGLFGCGNTKSEALGESTFKEPDAVSIVDTEKWGNVPVNQIVVVFEDDIDKLEAVTLLKQIGGDVVGQMEMINLYQLETNFTTEAELTAAIDAALAMDGVEAAFPNVEVYGKDIEGTPCTALKDPIFENTANAAHYNTIGMENAWRIIKGSGVELNKVNVGVLDDAIYTGSDEFKGKVNVTGDTTDEPEKNSSDQIIDDGLNHGTMVTHVIGADPENSGMVGVASVLEENLNIDVTNLYDGKKSFQTTIADEDDITQATETVDGVDYTYTVKALVYLKEQVDNGATVINCSYGPKAPNDDLEFVSKAYEKFFKKIQETNPDVIFVAAAGNEAEADKSKGALNGKNYYPAGLNLPNVITVGALQNDGKRADFSNFATDDGEVTLSAPGVKMVLGVDKDGKPVTASGTSFAAPQVTATIALIQSINPELSAAQVKELLVETAAKGVTTGNQSIPIPQGMGAGVLRVDVAVLKTINDLREEQGKAPYTFDQLFNNTFVSLSASGGPLEYKVTAGIPMALNGSADVKIEVSGGQHALGGSSTQRVTAGGATSWDLTLGDEPVFVRVTRLDNGGCATLSLDPTIPDPMLLDLTGTWTGTAILVGGDDVEDIEPDNPISLSLSFNNSAGTANVQGFSTGVIVSNDGTNLNFALSGTESMYGIKLTTSAVFTGTVTAEGDGLSMGGSMTLTLMGQGNTVTYYYEWSAYR